MAEKRDILLIRELAKKYMEIACSEKHVRMRKRFRDSNDLKIVRPPVIIEEIPWEQMNLDHALDCVSEDPALRKVEYSLRIALFREKYLCCDNYIEPCMTVGRHYESSGSGLPGRKERTLAQKNTDIMSHTFEDVLADESSLENFHLPVITAHPEKDREEADQLREILGDTVPVEIRGHLVFHCPWDDLAFLRGVEPILYDLYERPEYLHRIMRLLTAAKQAEIDQMEALGLLDPRAADVHCTPAAVTVPGGHEEGGYRASDVWYRTIAQMFSAVSPAMHDEFDVQYSLPIAKRFAFTYYGCCEPLSDRLDVIMQIQNLRKVGCSPWSDVDRTAEVLGKNYVLSKKPSPSNVAIRTDKDVVRREIEQTVKACQKNGTPCDITLKDISTVGERPENLIVWAETVSEVLDAYYGE